MGIACDIVTFWHIFSCCFCFERWLLIPFVSRDFGYYHTILKLVMRDKNLLMHTQHNQDERLKFPLSVLGFSLHSCIKLLLVVPFQFPSILVKRERVSVRGGSTALKCSFANSKRMVTGSQYRLAAKAILRFYESLPPNCVSTRLERPTTHIKKTFCSVC